MLADAGKDSGALSMFPELAGRWMRQMKAESGWERFRFDNFGRLKTSSGLTES